MIRSRMGGFWLGSLLMAASLTATHAAEDSPASPWTPARMLQVQRIGSVQVSPGGRRVAWTVRQAIVNEHQSEYLTHIHLGHVDGRDSRQLTQGDKSCDDPQWSPDGSRLAFLSSRGGKKNVWIINPDGGEAARLTDFPGDVSSFRWAPDGNWLAVSALDPVTPDEDRARTAKADVRIVDENIKRQRLYLVPASDPVTLATQPRLLTPGERSVGGDGPRPGRPPFDWSPDGRSIVYSHTFSPHPNDWPTAEISVVDVESAAVRPLAHTAVSETTPFYSPDGTQIAYVASTDPPTWGGHRRVYVLPAEGGSPRPLAETSDQFGRYSELLGWSADGQSVYVTEVQGTVFKVLALPLQGEPVALSRDTGMSLQGAFLNAGRTHFGFGWETLQHPPEAYITPVENWSAVRVSQVQIPEVLQSVPTTEVIRWKSTDGLEIEGLVTYPRNYVAGQKYPLLLVIHGGPMGVYTQTFDGNPAQYPVAAFAERGYAILRANVRGSSGYGAKFRHANYNDWGGGDFQDQLTGVDALIAKGLADPDRLGVMGWSYGGFLTAWTITHSQRFKAASVGAGVTNLMSFTGTADIPGFLPDYFHGEFWNDLAPYAAHSPMFHVKGVRTPTLIQHGERDERVPLSQGQELYNSLKRQGCLTQMVIYPRTPHGIEEPRLLLDCMERNLAWFDRFLQPDGPAETAGGR